MKLFLSFRYFTFVTECEKKKWSSNKYINDQIQKIKLRDIFFSYPILYLQHSFFPYRTDLLCNIKQALPKSIKHDSSKMYSNAVRKAICFFSAHLEEPPVFFFKKVFIFSFFLYLLLKDAFEFLFKLQRHRL